MSARWLRTKTTRLSARFPRMAFGELGVRGGLQTEKFYAGLGWVECGRLVGGIRVGPGDDRDDIWMMRRF